MLSAILRASAADMMPSCSPSLEITLISLSRISSLICCSLLLMLKHLLNWIASYEASVIKKRGRKTQPRIKSTLKRAQTAPVNNKLLTNEGRSLKVRANLLCFIVQVILIYYLAFVKHFFDFYRIFLKSIKPADTPRPKARNKTAVRPLTSAPFAVQ